MLDNTLFYAGDMKDILNDEFIQNMDVQMSSQTLHVLYASRCSK